jgi:hypothetical protein
VRKLPRARLQNVSASASAKPPARKTSSSGSSRFPISGPGSCSSRYAGATACNHSATSGRTVKPS